jgi:hypothetical protein
MKANCSMHMENDSTYKYRGAIVMYNYNASIRHNENYYNINVQDKIGFNLP